MNTPEAMQIFLRVAELASFTQAADHMGLPKATVSGAVRQLENEVGALLLHRTTRRVQLTADGAAFYERCKDLLADLEDVTGMFRASPAALRGRLRIDLPVRIARDLVLPALPDFLAEHPLLAVELSCTDRPVDLIREGFDLVLRVGPVGDDSLVGKALGCLRQINCASPAYLATHGTPTDLAALADHRLVHYATTLGGRCEGFEWQDEAGQTRSIALTGSLTVNHSDAYEAAALAGLGIIQAPVSGLREHLAAGRLREILPGFQAAPLPVTLLYGNRRHLPRRTRAFMNWLQDLLQAQLTPTP